MVQNFQSPTKSIDLQALPFAICIGFLVSLLVMTVARLMAGRLSWLWYTGTSSSFSTFPSAFMVSRVFRLFRRLSGLEGYD